DRAPLDAGLERNGVLIHVDAEERIACFHTRSGHGGLVDRNRARSLQTADELRRARGVRIDGEARNAELIDARDDDPRAVPPHALVVELRPAGETADAEDLLDGSGRVGTMDADSAQR